MANATRVLVAAALVAAVVAPASVRSHSRAPAAGALEYAPSHRGDPGNAIVAARRDRALVALTFDDGPLPAATTKVLAFLRRERVRATFS